jgi:adenylosuccinate synthase
VRYATRVNGLSGLAVTKLDVLDSLDRIAICNGYKVGDEEYREFPGDVTALAHIEPIYEWFEGWQQPTSEARTLDALPAKARRYLDRIRELVAAPIVYVSVGTRRDQIIGLE